MDSKSLTQTIFTIFMTVLKYHPAYKILRIFYKKNNLDGHELKDKLKNKSLSITDYQNVVSDLW